MFDTLPALGFTASAPTSVEQVGLYDNEDVVVASVTKRNLASMGDEWSDGGCYLLLCIPTLDHVSPIYVGLASHLRKRVRTQLSSSPDVLRALVIRSAARPFDPAQAAHLEQVLFDRLLSRRYIRLLNSGRPNGSRAVSEYHRHRLEGLVVPSIMSVLRLNGLNPDDEERRMPGPVLPTLDAATDSNPMSQTQDAQSTTTDTSHRARPTGEDGRESTAKSQQVRMLADGPLQDSAAGSRIRRTPSITDRDVVLFTLMRDGAAHTYREFTEQTGATYDALRQRLPKLRNAGLLATNGVARTGEAMWCLTADGLAVLDGSAAASDSGTRMDE